MCEHLDASRLTIHPLDQAIGVHCHACASWFTCWQDGHIPESIWNLACTTNDGEPCGEDRGYMCAICVEAIERCGDDIEIVALTTR